MPRVFGYSRYPNVSPERAISDAEELKDLGCDVESIFLDDDLSERAKGPELQRLIESVGVSDRIIVLAFRKGSLQSYEILTLAEQLLPRRVSISIPRFGIETATKAGMTILRDIVAARAELQDYRARRIREGVAAAHANGAYKGRVPTARRKSAAVEAFWKDGRSAIWIAEKLRISRASVYRIIQDMKEAER